MKEKVSVLQKCGPEKSKMGRIAQPLTRNLFRLVRTAAAAAAVNLLVSGVPIFSAVWPISTTLNTVTTMV